MNLDKNNEKAQIQFEIIEKLSGKKYVLRGERLIIGRSEACDVMIRDNSISSIHAVFELQSGHVVVYDMDSSNGTFIDGEKIVARKLEEGELLKLGELEFSLRKVFFRKDEVSESKLPGNLPSAKQAKKLSKDKDLSPNYPLVLERDLNSSEYIFEDDESIYPIFVYEKEKTATEVIILFKEKVYSVDYLSDKNGTYNLKGKGYSSTDVEFPYLRKDERIPLVIVENGSTIIRNLSGFNMTMIGAEKEISESEVRVQGNQIYRLVNNDIAIYVRSAVKPPSIKPAPILSQDKTLNKYIIIMTFLVALFLLAANMFTVDEELKKEKAPERIVSLLHKKKRIAKPVKKIPKKKEPKKMVNKPKVNEQKAVTKVSQNKKKVKTDSKKKNVKIVGEKTPKKKLAKKVAPNKAKKDNRKTTRVSTKKKTGGNTKVVKTKRATRKSPTKAKGHVDVYKATSFKSTISSFLTKGGALSTPTKNLAKNTGDLGSTEFATGGESATLKSAKVSKNVGSLAGSTRGKIDSTQGLSGVSSKKSLMTVGIPTRTVVLGAMDPEVIRQILMDHSSQFQSCYQRTLSRSRNQFSGVLPLEFVIGASGHVTSAGVSSNTNLPNSVKKCAINVLKGIKFPEPLGGGTVAVKQPFNFRSTTK